jgi:hypothetical protein
MVCGAGCERPPTDRHSLADKSRNLALDFVLVRKDVNYTLAVDIIVRIIRRQTGR